MLQKTREGWVQRKTAAGCLSFHRVKLDSGPCLHPTVSQISSISHKTKQKGPGLRDRHQAQRGGCQPSHATPLCPGNKNHSGETKEPWKERTEDSSMEESSQKGLLAATSPKEKHTQTNSAHAQTKQAAVAASS